MDLDWAQPTVQPGGLPVGLQGAILQKAPWKCATTGLQVPNDPTAFIPITGSNRPGRHDWNKPGRLRGCNREDLFPFCII